MARKSRKDVVTQEKPKKAAMKIWRAALYIRLSVEFNGKKGDSLETQRQIMEAYIALCPDIEIAEVYTDNGTTGRTFEREEVPVSGLSVSVSAALPSGRPPPLTCRS